MTNQSGGLRSLRNLLGCERLLQVEEWPFGSAALSDVANEVARWGVVYGAYETMVREAPAGHAMDYVHVYLTIAKAQRLARSCATKSRRAVVAQTNEPAFCYRQIHVTSSFPSEHPDAATVAGLRAGDHQVFRQIVHELNPGLTRMARTYVPDALADEVVQETWMAVVKSIDGFEGRSALKSWIYRILLNKVRTLAVREAKIVPFTSVGPQADGVNPSVDPDRLVHPDFGQGYWPAAPARWDTLPDERLVAQDTTDRIKAAINKLPEAQQEVVRLRDVEGWSAQEVCNALGISSVNQRVLLHRGRVAVREALEEYLS